MFGLPVSVIYDSTDNLLGPTEGVRLTASVTPFPSFLGSDPGIVCAKGTASTYYALDNEANYVLAGRIGLGSVSGASLAEIPDNFRFFVGGGSVRGFSYRTLGPRGPFNLPIGGRSLFEVSVEARLKVTDTIGVVPFFDMGTAFASPVPDFDERIRKALGLGLRYYTSIGPSASTSPSRSTESRDTTRASGRPVYQPGAGVLMQSFAFRSWPRLRLSRVRLLTLVLVVELIVAFGYVGLPQATEGEKTVLGGLLSKVLSTPTSQVSIGAVDGDSPPARRSATLS